MVFIDKSQQRHYFKVQLATRVHLTENVEEI